MKELKVLLSISSMNRRMIDEVVDSVLGCPRQFSHLYALTTNENPRTAHHALWACEKLSYQRPELFMKKREELKKRAMSASQEEGVRRILLNLLLYLPQEKDVDVRFLNYCLDDMFSPNRAPAVQALLLKHAFTLCSKEPELFQEFIVLLENIELDYYSPAVTSTVRNILKRIKKR